MPDDTWELEYMAKESAHAGQIVSEFDRTQHVNEEGYMGTLVRGIDWGIAHPTVCLWINVDMENFRVYVSDEYTKSGMLIKESCDVIRAKTGERPVEWTVIDPSTAKRSSQTGRTDKDEFARWGVSCVAGDNKDRGYDIMKMFFKRNMIKIHPKCKNLILQIKNVQWGDKEGEDCLDTLRYTLVRIHDLMFGGRFATEFIPDYTRNTRELNVHDENIFPQESKRLNWVMDEAQVY